MMVIPLLVVPLMVVVFSGRWLVLLLLHDGPFQPTLKGPDGGQQQE
jgi:hypothetical protein